uniref:Translocon-associated protein subunit beta n=1 Tax=Setaria digitata TaxID=48799 RepID=A0A915PQV6_9BILA
MSFFAVAKPTDYFFKLGFIEKCRPARSFHWMSRPVGLFERLASAAGHIYRYQLTQLPRRKALWKDCWHKELKPPTLEDWPFIKKDFKQMMDAVVSRSYTQWTVMDAFVRTCVAVEIICWFFVGEAIGRRSFAGYIVPANYIDKKLANVVKRHKDHTYNVATSLVAVLFATSSVSEKSARLRKGSMKIAVGIIGGYGSFREIKTCIKCLISTSLNAKSSQVESIRRPTDCATSAHIKFTIPARVVILHSAVVVFAAHHVCWNMEVRMRDVGIRTSPVNAQKSCRSMYLLMRWRLLVFLMLYLNVTFGEDTDVNDSAHIVASKFTLSQYAVEGMDYVIDYRLYNVGDRAALRVALDDRDGFPTQAFDVIRGLLQVRWERISPSSNVSHSVVVRPRTLGSFNYSSAQITYYPNEDAKEVRISYTTAPGEGYIYRRKDYDRKFSAKVGVWLIFLMLVAPSTIVPFVLWYQKPPKGLENDATGFV